MLSRSHTVKRLLYHLAMFTEDFEDMLEQEDDITPEEQAWLMAQPDIIDKISSSFENYDSFWECYWNVFQDIAEEKLKEYRKNNKE